jgi:HD superfamily phosphodiesterase
MTLVNLDEKFREDVADLLDLPELHASRLRVHHFDLTEYDHLMQVAQTAHRVSRFLRADARVSARAGLLHDLGAHWFNTVKPVALATRLEETHAVRHAIRAHTLLPTLPRTREAWAVVAADFITTARECHFMYRRARAGAIERVNLKGAATHIRTRARLISRPRRIVQIPVSPVSAN